MTNRSYRLRKGFSEKEGVEEVDFKKVNRIPKQMEAWWKYRIDRQDITGYNVGEGMSLVIFDYREGKYSYWADRNVSFLTELHNSEAEEVFGFLKFKED